MSIGETLARARRDAGLSIADISRRTSIRLSVIDEIEHDNYSACGGDDRARANIAAIAKAVDIEAGPLIEAFETPRRPTGWIAASSPSEPTPAAQAPEAFTPEPEPKPPPEPEPEPEPETEPEPDVGDTQPIVIGGMPDPVTTGEPDFPVTAGQSRYPAGPAETAIPAWLHEPIRMAFAERRPLVWIAMGGILVAIAALGGILVITGASGQPRPPAVAAGQHHVSNREATHPASSRRSGHSAISHRRTRPASPASRPSVQALVPASIAAFGPGGTGQGDSPQLASQALAGKAAAPWHSAWYTTSRFGNLQSGTGLLLNMGRTVTITSARISLVGGSGADLALRVGKSPTMASLSAVAHANGAGGVVRLKTAPTRGRYVLVWFTKLPADQSGTFQVSVYRIKLSGYR